MSGLSRTRRWIWRVVTLTVLLGVPALMLSGQGQFFRGTLSGPTDTTSRISSCLPGEPVEIMNSRMISHRDASTVEYNSIPPTSGPRYAFTVAPGVYQSPIPEGLSVRAMEHGHVIIQYAPTTATADIAALSRVAKRHGANVILAPYPELDHGIALTAWGRIDHLDRYDERRVTEFIEELSGRYNHGWTTDDDCA